MAEEQKPNQDGRRAPSAEELLMVEARALYLDTEPFVASQWPSISGRLRAICALARDRGIPVFVPVPVLQELEQQFQEDVAEALRAVRKADKALRKLTGGDDRQVQPDSAAALASFRSRSEAAIRELGVEIISASNAAAATLFERAVQRGRPFHVSGNARDAGFKDAFILQSICDHVEANGFQRAVIVSSDSDQAGVESFHKVAPRVTTRTLASTLDALRLGAYRADAVEGFVQRLKVVGEAAEAEHETFAAFAATELRSRPLEMGPLGSVTAIEQVTAKDFFAADLFPAFADVAAGGRADVILVVLVMVDAIMTRKDVDAAALGASMKDKLIAYLVADEVEARQAFPLLVEIEATATRSTGGYSNFEPRSLKILPDLSMEGYAVDRSRWTRPSLGR